MAKRDKQGKRYQRRGEDHHRSSSLEAEIDDIHSRDSLAQAESTGTFELRRSLITRAGPGAGWPVYRWIGTRKQIVELLKEYDGSAATGGVAEAQLLAQYSARPTGARTDAAVGLWSVDLDDASGDSPETQPARPTVERGEDRAAWIVDHGSKTKIGPFAPGGHVGAWREQHAPGRAILMNDAPLLGKGDWLVVEPQRWIARQQRISAERGRARTLAREATAEMVADERPGPAEVELPEGAILTTAGEADRCGWEVMPFGGDRSNWLPAHETARVRGTQSIVVARPKPVPEPPAELVGLIEMVTPENAEYLAKRLIAKGWIAKDRLDG